MSTKLAVFVPHLHDGESRMTSVSLPSSIALHKCLECGHEQWTDLMTSEFGGFDPVADKNESMWSIAPRENGAGWDFVPNGDDAGPGALPIRVFLAARYSKRVQMLSVMRELERDGYEVTSRWLSGMHEFTVEEYESLEDDVKSSLRAEWATEDWADVAAADIVVLFTEEPRSPTRGGRLVEFGIALGMGKRVIVVGPEENVYCALQSLERFPTWSDVVNTGTFPCLVDDG